MIVLFALQGARNMKDQFGLKFVYPNLKQIEQRMV